MMITHIYTVMDELYSPVSRRLLDLEVGGTVAALVAAARPHRQVRLGTGQTLVLQKRRISVIRISALID